jgi:predicted ATP-grasp superfamily ATP-dependent carboligase
VYSLYEAGYKVYVIDFFGDLDLSPYVKDSIILTKRLGSSYDVLKDNFSNYLIDFTLELLKKYNDIDFIIIGSGLDDALKERKTLAKKIEDLKFPVLNLNNSVETIEKARDLRFVYSLLSSKGYKIPKTLNLEEYMGSKAPKRKDLEYPIILKKTKSSGGLNVFQIENEDELELRINILASKNKGELSSWVIQEYLKGLSVSCTTISSGVNSEVISVNRQIIGLNFLNPPHKYMYCGNIVPGRLLDNDIKLIKEISLFLTNKLELKGINGFDFVLKNHYPYLMEINPRIPGSIRASEEVLNLNLLDLYIKSFFPKFWKDIKLTLNSTKLCGFCTKLIFYAPKKITKQQINSINSLECIHDKSDPQFPVNKNEPVCTILYKDISFAKSFFGALKIANKIKDIIS